jgi:phosphatidylserine/phosphatidylglycerophosphate/cardiolipin synthase-like enzyme
MFIVDVTPRARRFLVDDLLRQLRTALSRGVDVRVVVSGSNDTLAILESSAIATRRLHQFRVPVRWAAKSVRSNHSKVLLCDDHVLIGSHNWSADAFSGSTQDSVLVSSTELCGAMAQFFARAWNYYVA